MLRNFFSLQLPHSVLARKRLKQDGFEKSSQHFVTDILGYCREVEKANLKLSKENNFGPKVKAPEAKLW